MSLPLENRSWDWLEIFLFLGRTAWILFNGMVNVLPLYTDPSKISLLIAWFILIYLFPYVFNRPGYRKLPYYLAAEFILTGSMFFFLVHEFSAAGPDILSFLSFPVLTMAFVSQSRRLIWISPIVMVLVIVSSLFFGDFFGYENTSGRLVDLVMFYAFGFILGRVALINNSRKELIQAIELKNKTLEQYSERIEELTIKEERSRVSQEMHDTVGHIFTSVITSLDALPFLIKANPQQASTIKEISTLARKGLREVRAAIHQLSPAEESDSLFDLCETIITDFIRHTHTNINFKTDGTEQILSNSVKNTVIRCLQESLTNAKRHGQATKINVTISFNTDVLLLEIEDNGIGSEIKPGFGLTTMKDRLLTVGGTFSIESIHQKGTKITCMIPLRRRIGW